MNSKEFFELGKATIDLIADFYDNIRNRNVQRSVEQGYLVKILPEDGPAQPEEHMNVLKDFYETIMPGVTCWRSPQFQAFYPAGNSFGIITGGLLGDGIGVIRVT